MPQTNRILLFVFIYLFSSAMLFADGSKDLYPPDVAGNRAFLVSHSPSKLNKFYNQAAHFVFAKAGETISVASSAMGVRNGAIRLTSPGNNVIIVNEGDKGRISPINGGKSTRKAELDGPYVGYNPYDIDVTAEGEGIWKIEFIPTRWSDEKGDQNPDSDLVVKANEDWKQQDNSYYISAWDISMRKTGSFNWIKGRVYTNLLHLYISATSMSNEEGAFYGKNYVLTKDGYIYKVDGNGCHGIDFQYFVNNSGILDDEGNPSYRSLDLQYQDSAPIYLSSDFSGTEIFFNPNSPDYGPYVTHKMFYGFPDVTMPESSKAPMPIEQTWLFRNTQIAEVKNIKLTGYEGKDNFISKKGVNITFETNYSGRYKVVIRPKGGQSFSERYFIIQAVEGFNTIYWDGMDGLQKLMPEGEEYPIELSVSLLEGEIHFPYFDMEVNPQGIIVDRMNNDGTPNSPAIMYWNDSKITPGIYSEQSTPLAELSGVSSRENGHRWGTYSTNSKKPSPINSGKGAYSFGNEKAMDSWSYSIRAEETTTRDVTVKIADLEVISVSADKDIIELGDQIKYKVKIRNNGPSDVEDATFYFKLPYGFDISKIIFDSACGQMVGKKIDKHIYTARVDLKNQCEGEVTIIASAHEVDPVPYGIVYAEASLVRPRDYTDPDATSTNRELLSPGSAEEECLPQPLSCNNIKINPDVVLLEPFDERGALTLIKTVNHYDIDNNGFQEPDEVLKYSFTIQNTGKVSVSDIYIVDSLLVPARIDAKDLTLEPGKSVTLSGKYIISSDDADKGKVQNSAKVFASNPRGFLVKDISGPTAESDAPTVIDIDTAPIIRLRTKLKSKEGTGYKGQFTVGDVVEYQLDIRHSGLIPVGKLQIFNERFDDANRMLPIDYIRNTTVSYIYTYTVTQADIDRGYIEQTTKVVGFDEKGNREIVDFSGNTFDDDRATITPTAKAAKAIGDTYVVHQGNEGILDVLKNDIIGSSELSLEKIEVTGLPKKGSVVIANGTIRYIPLDNATYGTDTLSYVITDKSRLRSNEATVHIEIKKTVPVAVEDYVAVGYNYQAKINPTKNDYSEHSFVDLESIKIVTPTRDGDLTYGGNGIYVYRPAENFTGFDSFTYVFKDNNDNWSEPATVILEVKGLFFPNAITPNGDQVNDSFTILGLYSFDQVELEVVDRFGRIIYSSTNYRNDWIVDSAIKEGTYFYTFKGMKNGSKTLVKQGSLLIMRNIKRL